VTGGERPAHTCPSSTCTGGNLLIGIVRPDGTVAPIRPALEIDEAFVARARAGQRAPEARMRFAGGCAESACGHWRDARCGLVELLTDAGAPAGQGSADAGAGAGADADADAPPPCPIRATCRWWAQRGVAACRICPTIVRGPNGPFSSGELSGDTAVTVR
jgi:hypothetical protein